VLILSCPYVLAKSELGHERVQLLYQETGAPFHSAYALAQLRVWYRQNSDNNPLVAQWQTLASACLGRWTGQTSLPISYSEASWTGLLNVRTCEYERNVLDLLPLECREALPKLADYDGFVSNSATMNEDTSSADRFLRITKNSVSASVSPYHDRWPALRNAKLLLGVGDGACANIGSHCSIPCRIACTVGTSAAARICLPFPLQKSDANVSDGKDSRSSLVVQPGLFCYRIDRSHILVGGALTDGGSVIEWVANLLNRPMKSDSFAECLRQAEEHLEQRYHEAASPSLVMAPFWSGERSTGFRSEATGAIMGLTLNTTPAHLVYACLEGVTLRLNAIVQLLLNATVSSTTAQSCSSEPVQVVCSGKALEENALWRRMLADCTGLDVVLDRETVEGSSRGVAILARAALSHLTGHWDRTIDYEAAINVSDLDTSVSCEGAQDYWKEAARTQESFINAVFPLNNE
jgi:gluconokinase